MRKNKLAVAQFLVILAFSTISYFFEFDIIPAVYSSPNGAVQP